MIKKILRFRNKKIGEANKQKLRSRAISFSLIFALFTLSNLFAQAPGRPHVNAPDVTMSCTDESVIISAEYLEIGETQSNIYDVTEIEYAPPFPYTGGTIVDATQDDRWSPEIELPFDFCFFGEVETTLHVGTNGVISFNSYTTTELCPWSFSASVPSPSLIRNAIYGVYMDIHPGYAGAGEINYAFFGEAPARTLVVNFPDQPYFGTECPNHIMTSQIVIYETTNVIEVYVNRRDDGCSWNSGNAVIGIQNAAGTAGFTPPNRNTGDWSATKEAWRFTPAGEDVYEFWWEDADGVEIGTEDSMEVFPTSPNDTYTAVIEYTNCNGEVVREEDTVHLIIEPDFTVDLGRDKTICAEGSYTLEPTITPMPDEELSYLWSTGETTPTIEVTESGVYSVEVSVNGFLGPCGTSDEVEITINDYPLVDLGPDVETCFEDGYIILDATPTNMDVNDVSFTWYYNGEEIEGAMESTYTADDTGLYGVEVTAEGCTTYEDINILPGNDLVVDLGENVNACEGEEVTLVATTNEQDVTFSWYLNDELIAGETSNSITVSVRDAQTPDIYRVVIETGVCTGEHQVEVGTYGVNCVISEGISPGGSDGYNDTFDLEFLHDRSGIKKLQIFNRYGTIVFEKANYTNEWYGQSDGNDELPSGVYYYVIDLERNDVEYGTQATGWVYLMRE